MSSVGTCYQGQVKRGQQKVSCAFGHERQRYRTMQPFLGFDSTVEVASYEHNYHIPNSGLVQSGNVMEKLNELTCVASNWLSNMCPRQTSQNLAKDSAATIPNFLRDLFSSNYNMTADKRKMDYSSGCGNIGSGSLSTVRGWGAPYHRNNITRHYCSKRGHMGQKQIPLYPSNMLNDGILSSFVKSNFPPTNVHDRMDKSRGSHNRDMTHFCKHRCVMQDTQLEKLAEEAKMKPYNTKLRLKALMGQKCSICQKNMEGQIDDHAATKKEELDVSSEQRVDRSTGNHKANSQRTSDAQICIKLKTCDNAITRKDVHDDVYWKNIGAEKPTGHAVNLQQTCSSSANESMETCDTMSETKEDDSVNKIEIDSQIDWFEYSCAQGGIMPISDVIQPSLSVKISKPIDTHVVACDSDSQTLKSYEKKNEKWNNKSATPHSWSCVEELPDFAKTPEVAPENSPLSTSKSDCKVENSISGDSSNNGKEDNEEVSADNSKKMSDSDMSCVLYIRKCSASKKTRPSSKKRRRQKAKLQQVPQHCRDNPAKDENLSGSKTLASMLGMDSSPINSHFSHSFIVSFDDGDSDWSDSDEFDCSPEETGKDDFCEMQNSFGLMNLSCKNGTMKESKPHTESRQEECSKHDLDAINMSWKINIQLNDRPTEQKSDRRKVHFANDKTLVTLHPMIAWSYAYATARKGPWEEYARDRDRFQRRIEETECILAPILKPDHRSTVYNLYFEAE